MVGHPDTRTARPLPQTSPVPGSEFAGHMVEAIVGRGGMGVVYRARHRGLDRVVALKVILPELLDDATIHQRFVAEAITAASIEHPNVVPVHDAGDVDGLAYMTMRYVQGMDLRALVRARGPLAPARAAEVVSRVGDALDAIHACGFVHRDVKPRNVLIARGGHVYLGDFGLARPATSHSGATRTGEWVGTVDYVAPERIQGAPADARTDTYALGGLLHFALTGRPPYERDNDGARLWAHVYDPPPVPSRLQAGVPRAFDAVISRALAKDPASRYSSAGELAADATRAAAAAPLRPRQSRSRLAALASVGVAGAVLAGWPLVR